ncbi:MAG: hypothetical protein M3464_01175 [Chloroflexota bacterium]|nr:hypothetical protein [Chloroflexota bacterium]
MTVETRCRRCGITFSPNRDVILAGAWRLCDDCRDRDEAEAEHLLSNERAAKRARPRDWWAADRARRRQEKAG